MLRIVGWLIYLGILVFENIPIAGAGLIAGIVSYRIAKKWIPKPIALLLAASFPIYAGHYIYRGFYPDDAFYRSEYKAITRDSSISTIKIKYGSATYPTFHPDYCSTAILEFEKSKYDSVIREIKRNLEFKDTVLVGSEAYGDVIKHMKKKPVYLERFSRRDQSNHYFIGLMAGNEALINRCYD